MIDPTLVPSTAISNRQRRSSMPTPSRLNVTVADIVDLLLDRPGFLLVWIPIRRGVQGFVSRSRSCDQSFAVEHRGHHAPPESVDGQERRRKTEREAG
jgi:hypothetical protein